MANNSEFHIYITKFQFILFYDSYKSDLTKGWITLKMIEIIQNFINNILTFSFIFQINIFLKNASNPEELMCSENDFLKSMVMYTDMPIESLDAIICKSNYTHLLLKLSSFTEVYMKVIFFFIFTSYI